MRGFPFSQHWEKGLGDEGCSSHPTRRGFTLIEMTVIITVLALLAGLIIPNLVAVRRSQKLRDLEASVLRLPLEARNEARRSRVPVALRVEGDALVMERLSAEEEPQLVKSISLGTDLQAQNAQKNGESIDLASWQWTAYPDGSADSGGVEFTQGAAQKSLVLPKDGEAKWVRGELPDTTQEKWPAGDIEQRA